ncbi:MAG: cupin domain-containing protein [Negativicutes bacterium]|nr:cupin domain-containing protein [Negativicutes bacterium]
MESTYTYIPDLLKSMSAVPEDSIVSRVIAKGERLDVTLFGFAAGQELTEHTSPYRAIIQVLAGQAQITLGKDTVTAEAGAWIHMLPNLPHSLKAASPFVMLLTLIKGE